MPTNDPSPSSLSRRSLVKAAAWTAPVLALSVATPLASASTGPDLELILPGTSFSVKSTGLQVGVGVIGNASAWSGSFTFTLDFFPDDSVLIAMTAPGTSDPNPSATSTPGWTFVSWGAPGPNGVYSATWAFAGSIPVGGSAVLILDNVVERLLFDRVSPSTVLPVTLTRTGYLTSVVGVPATDTAIGNVVAQSVQYT